MLEPMVYRKFRVRTCPTINASLWCAICKKQIQYGERYYDGGNGQRAHVGCVEQFNSEQIDNIRPTASCAECLYYQVVNEETPNKHCECHRRSPIIIEAETNAHAAWPVVLKDDWCGEYIYREYGTVAYSVLSRDKKYKKGEQK